MISPPRFTYWWLNPAWCFGLVCGITLLLAFLQSPADYGLYGTSKYLRSWHLLVGGLSIFSFSIGCYLGRFSPGTDQQQQRVDHRVLRRWFHVFVALTIFGYLVWLAVGIRNGASPSLLIEILFSDDATLIESVREDYFPTIPGITTCTQFGLPAILLGLWLYFFDDRKAIGWVCVLVTLATIRAILISERLALIELVVPATILVLRVLVLPLEGYRWLRRVGTVAPVVAPLILVIVFGSFEYVRSWHYYKNDFDSYPQFVVWRLSGYYTTAHNNGAMAMETAQSRPLPYVTLEPLWEFPGVESSPLGYPELTGLNMPEVHVQMLENFGNPELNNGGGLFQPMLDWGLPGALIFWFGYGLLAGRIYQYYLMGTLGGVLFYPAIFYTLLDAPRILVICNPRFAPMIAVMVLMLLLTQRWSDNQP